MQTGQYLRLNRETAAIDNSGGKPTAMTVPTGAVITATSVRSPHNPQMVEVHWNDRRLFMFAIDIQERGEMIMDAGEHAG